MKSPRLKLIASRTLLSALSGVALASLTGRAQSVNTAAPDAKTLAQYDKNKNGRLDPAEQAALDADLAKAAKSTAASATSDNGEKVVELSPFEVSGGSDKGYFASNTMSGTRLNSKIEDLAASITVITKQQLMDTAAVDINDIFLYEANTEGIGQFSDPTNDGRGIYDNVAGNPQTANRVRGLGAANIAVGGFAANSLLPIDSYNIDAVEISRGPNSNIFGMGDPSGTVNLVPSKANATREISNFTARVDSYGGFRSTIDLNRPLVKGPERSAALRFNAAYEEKGFIRKPSSDRTNRWQIATTLKPFRNTTINASYESYHNFNSRANSETPRDTVAYWRSQGRPTWDPITFPPRVGGVLQPAVTAANDALLPAGLAAIGSANVRVQAFIDGGAYALLMPGVNPALTVNGVALTNANQRVVFSGTNIQRGGGGIFGGVPTPLFNMPETTDKSIYDWTKYNLAAPNYNRMRSDNYNVRLEQSILNTPRNILAAQVEWMRQDTFEYRRSFVAQQDGVPAVLQVDTNEKLLDGTPNPYFLRPFIGGNEPQLYLKPVFNDNYRSQVAYQLDLTRETNWMKWIGRHRFSGYGEFRQTIGFSNGGLRYRDQIVDNPNFVTLTNITGSNGAHLYNRYFLGGAKSDGAIEYANPGLIQPNGKFPSMFLNRTTGVWNRNEQVDIEEIYFALGNQKKKIRTMGLSVQSYVLDERVIPTFGWRRDRSYSEDNLGLPNTNGTFDITNLRNFGLNKKWNSGPTKTQGVVVIPFRGFKAIDEQADRGSGASRFFAQALRSFRPYYNRSDSFQPADTAYNLFGDVLPNPTGRGTERGFWLELFDSKVVLKVNQYETLQTAARSSLGTIATRANRIDFPLNASGAGADAFNLYQNATTWIQQINPSFTPAQQATAVAKLMGLPEGFVQNAQGKAVSDINDARSKGYEFELNFNPTRYWTLKGNFTKQEAIDSNLSPYIQSYLDQRLPLWTTLTIPTTRLPDGSQLANAGALWWNTAAGSAGTPNAFYVANVLAPLKLAITTQGKPKPQSRGLSYNFTTNYRLAGITEHKWLKNLGVGGSFRWADRAVIGFLGGPPDADGQVRSLDGNKRVYSPATTNADLLLSYDLRFWNNKIRSRVQLNVRNITESGGLRPIGVNPDGTIWRYRIIDPRQFILSTSFDL